MTGKHGWNRSESRKDESFSSDPHSPLPADEQEAFDGLDYDPISAEYHYELPLDCYDEPAVVVVGTSTEGEQESITVGEFGLTVDSKAVRLVAYRSDPDEERLWVLFRDATSGEETYRAGRYLALEPDRPLPPTENWLDVPIEVGEKADGHH